MGGRLAVQVFCSTDFMLCAEQNLTILDFFRILVSHEFVNVLSSVFERALQRDKLAILLLLLSSKFIHVGSTGQQIFQRISPFNFLMFN